METDQLAHLIELMLHAEMESSATSWFTCHPDTQQVHIIHLSSDNIWSDFKQGVTKTLLEDLKKTQEMSENVT